jgi:nicotinamide phosphoribosyltransferase
VKLPFNPAYLIDAYKIDHRRMYPHGTKAVYNNWTARGSRIDGVDKVVLFGLQAFFAKVLEEMFGEWFARDEDDVCAEYEARTMSVVGPNTVGVEHIRALHRLGYLPLRFCALPEGTEVPLRVPMFTVENTLDEFFWLTNYIESVMSAEIWMPCTTATLAVRMRRQLDWYASVSSDNLSFVDWQGHDFSFRGMASLEAAAASGAAHLLAFTGTDSLVALDWIDHYYPGSNVAVIGGSVPASEHSVMCAGGELGEEATFEHILNIYPTGIVSVVSDTWNLWSVLQDILPGMRDKIMNRDGKLVVRPDSGDPVLILCGDPDADVNDPAHAGVVELLWRAFGGTVNSHGLRELDSHIGVIYGDSITFERATAICERLVMAGYASTNVVFGIGSYTYQYVTRDTFGFAMKATWANVNGEGRDLYKDPVTDNGVKKSARGRLAVVRGDDGELSLIEQATAEQEATSLLQPVWENGKTLISYSWDEVAARVGLRTDIVANIPS